MVPKIRTGTANSPGTLNKQRGSPQGNTSSERWNATIRDTAAPESKVPSSIANRYSGSFSPASRYLALRPVRGRRRYETPPFLVPQLLKLHLYGCSPSPSDAQRRIPTRAQTRPT